MLVKSLLEAYVCDTVVDSSPTFFSISVLTSAWIDFDSLVKSTFVAYVSFTELISFAFAFALSTAS